jgi:hypothetical protein
VFANDVELTDCFGVLSSTAGGHGGSLVPPPNAIESQSEEVVCWRYGPFTFPTGDVELVLKKAVGSPIGKDSKERLDSVRQFRFVHA